MIRKNGNWKQLSNAVPATILVFVRQRRRGQPAMSPNQNMAI